GPEDVRTARFVATTDASAVPPASPGVSPDASDVVCGRRPVTFVPGPDGSWLVPRETTGKRIRLTINGAAPLPRFAAYAIRAGAPVSLVCKGGHSVTLRVVNAPVP